jgi:hypothetical protein
LTSGAARNYIDGFAAGTPSSLSEAARYITILESTFESWFSTPGGDPCTIINYSLHGSVSPLTNFPDSQVTLVGSKGSYKIWIDKTMPTNTRTFYLRAISRGLKTVDQMVTFVICPRTGGVRVTPPAEYTPKTVDMTNGIRYTLPSGSLYARLNY